MTKEDNINFKKLEAPNLEQINDIFQNNLKIYQNFIENYQSSNNKMNTKSGDDLGTASKKKFTPNDLLNLINPTTTKITQTLLDASSRLARNPTLYYEHINKWVQQIASLNFYFISKLSNHSANPIIEPEKTDKRFSSEEWSGNLFFDFIKQFYLITSKMMDGIVDTIEPIDPKQKKLIKFYINQINAAFSPSNFVATNPDLLNQTIKEGGQNLVKGFENFKNDYLKHPN